jgi:hypothetical protein
MERKHLCKQNTVDRKKKLPLMVIKVKSKNQGKEHSSSGKALA